jgi:hypothetical protein
VRELLFAEFTAVRITKTSSLHCYFFDAGVMTALPLRLALLAEGVSRRTAGLEALSSPAAAVCFLAWPSSVLRQREAKFSEQTVSPRLYTAGLMLTKVSTLELPPSESYSLQN